VISGSVSAFYFLPFFPVHSETYLVSPTTPLLYRALDKTISAPAAADPLCQQDSPFSSSACGNPDAVSAAPTPPRPALFFQAFPSICGDFFDLIGCCAAHLPNFLTAGCVIRASCISVASFLGDLSLQSTPLSCVVPHVFCASDFLSQMRYPFS